MHSKSTQTILSPTADSQAELQLVNYGNGFAWLRSERRYVLPSRYQLTDRARRVLAEDALFGPWPTVAQVSKLA